MASDALNTELHVLVPFFFFFFNEGIYLDLI